MFTINTAADTVIERLFDYSDTVIKIGYHVKRNAPNEWFVTNGDQPLFDIPENTINIRIIPSSNDQWLCFECKRHENTIIVVIDNTTVIRYMNTPDFSVIKFIYFTENTTLICGSSDNKLPMIQSTEDSQNYMFPPLEGEILRVVEDPNNHHLLIVIGLVGIGDSTKVFRAMIKL